MASLIFVNWVLYVKMHGILNLGVLPLYHIVCPCLGVMIYQFYLPFPLTFGNQFFH